MRLNHPELVHKHPANLVSLDFGLTCIYLVNLLKHARDNSC